MMDVNCDMTDAQEHSIGRPQVSTEGNLVAARLKQTNCVAVFDRCAFFCPRIGPSSSFRKPPSVPGFKTVAHRFPRRRTKIATWRQILFLESDRTGTKVRIQYDRAHGWLKHMKVTVIGPDTTGILEPELKAIGDAFQDFEICMLEVAFNFSPTSGVDQEYVKKHALFGKSRPVKMPKYPDSLRYGTRHSPRFVRCYWKQQVQAYRVELELHHSWLGLPQTDYLLYLFPLTERDFRFVNVHWDALDSHLATKGPKGKRIAAGARLHYGSIHELLRYLRSKDIKNPHRFLDCASKDTEIRKAFDILCDSFAPPRRRRCVNEETKD
jgi:hypothetical protein